LNGYGKARQDKTRARQDLQIGAGRQSKRVKRRAKESEQTNEWSKRVEDNRRHQRTNSNGHPPATDTPSPLCNPHPRPSSPPSSPIDPLSSFAAATLFRLLSPLSSSLLSLSLSLSLSLPSSFLSLYSTPALSFFLSFPLLSFFIFALCTPPFVHFSESLLHRALALSSPHQHLFISFPSPSSTHF